MKREIKFRAWEKVTSEDWCRQRGISYNPDFKGGMLFNICPCKYSNPESWVLMQYTGLKDKNGKEIYEGDIVKVDDRQIGAKEINIGEVYYCLDYALESNPCFAGWGKTGHFRLSPSIEVIGNIYENKELLNEDEPTSPEE